MNGTGEISSPRGSPLVSMIMPVWKPRRDWLLKAVEHALGQRDCDLELIVVDDGCEEPVEALLSSIDDSRLRVIRVTHGGVSHARNAGTAAAQGEYIRYVDSDDVCASGSTSHLLTLIGGRDDLIAYGATLICDEQLHPKWKMVSKVHGPAAVECLMGRFTVRHPSMLFPRRVIELAGEWDPSFRISSDWKFVLDALDHAQVRGDDRVATYYRRHSSSTTANIEGGEDAARRIVASYFERHPEQRGTRLERQAQGRVWAMAARVYATHGRPMLALGRLGRAFKLSPRAPFDEFALSLSSVVGRMTRRARLTFAGSRCPCDQATS